MNLKALISIFMALSIAISCSKVKFNNTPSNACAAADQCTVSPEGETLTKYISVPYPSNKVDILIVDDNSGTMIQEQQEMANRFSGFIQSISNLDWRIAIVTTDNATGAQNYRDAKMVPFLSSNVQGQFQIATDSQGRSIYFLEKSNPNANALFQNTIKRPESYLCQQNPTNCPNIVSGDERGIMSSIKAIQRNEYGFIRADAQLHVVIISDEDERSNGGGFPNMTIVEGSDRPEDLLNKLRSLNKRTRVHSIIGMPFNYYSSTNYNFEQCVANQVNDISRQEYQGCFYAKASADSGGIVGNKNSSSYTSILSAIGSDIQDTSISRVTFSCVPSEVKVESVGSAPYPANLQNPQFIYGLTNAFIDFNPALQPGTEIKVTWKCPRN